MLFKVALKKKIAHISLTNHVDKVNIDQQAA